MTTPIHISRYVDWIVGLNWLGRISRRMLDADTGYVSCAAWRIVNNKELELRAQITVAASYQGVEGIVGCKVGYDREGVL